MRLNADNCHSAQPTASGSLLSSSLHRRYPGASARAPRPWVPGTDGRKGRGASKRTSGSTRSAFWPPRSRVVNPWTTYFISLNLCVSSLF
ncbi:unnamed protein product [Gulo gulo]|uniref:Uncharacterized protein n=1 Tax=Gulo gulo TaxID=48420 RepID=A0A9X9LHR7_GULGU|nr:unnamed protein product [Gulo gulo]